MQATAYRSTRDHQWAAAHDPLFTACGAGVEISVSGLAQANRNRPIDSLVVLVQQVMDAVANLPYRRLRALDKETWQGIVDLLHRTDLFDATTLKLPPKVREWAKGTTDGSAALKLQLRIDGESGSFKQILLTPAPGPDAGYFETLLGDLEQQQGQLFLFDGGYWDIDTYHAIADSGNDFVTKRGGNVQPHLVKELPLPEEPLASGYVVLQDALVYLGDRQDLLYRMLQVRLSTDEEITLLNSLVHASADEICLLYRYRWTIEIVCTQMTKGNARAIRPGRDDITDFYHLVRHDNPVNEQFHQLPSLGESRLLQHGPDLRAECLDRGCHVAQLNLLGDGRLQLSTLNPQSFLFLSQLLALALEFGQGDDTRQVGFQQPLLLPFQLFLCLGQGVNAGTKFLGNPMTTVGTFRGIGDHLRVRQNQAQGVCLTWARHIALPRPASR